MGFRGVFKWALGVVLVAVIMGFYARLDGVFGDLDRY